MKEFKLVNAAFATAIALSGCSDAPLISGIADASTTVDISTTSVVPVGDISDGELLFSFDRAAPVKISPFNEGITKSTIVDDGNKIFKVTKTATAAFWEGAILSSEVLNSAPRLQLTGTDNILTVKVFSPSADVRVEIKLENTQDPAQNKEVYAYTTKANEWETLEWKLTAVSSIDDPHNIQSTAVYNKISMMFDQTRILDTDATFYLDDVYFQGELG